MKKLKIKLPLALLLCLSCMAMQGCWYSDSVSNRFAQVNYEASIAQEETQLALESLIDLEPNQERKLVYAKISNIIQQKVTEPHKKVLARLSQCFEGDKLVITARDQRELEKLLTVFTGSAADILNDTEIIRLNPTTRTTIMTALAIVPVAASKLLSIIQDLRPKKDKVPSLKEQVALNVTVPQLALTRNKAAAKSLKSAETLMDKIQAEVK